MPVYNCADYLKDAIESILGQTFRHFEFIIVNDGSTDNTFNLLNEYASKDSRIRIINQDNSGIVAALNSGLHAAKTEWIFRMDGDDIALPHRFEAQVKAIEKNNDLVLLGGWCQQIDAKGDSIRVNKYPARHAALISKLETLKPFFPHPTACYKKSVVMKLGGYRARFQHAEDTDLWLRMIGSGHFGCLPTSVLRLRKHSANVSNLAEGRIQLVRSLAARICHLRQKYGYSDPSLWEEKEWALFQHWIEVALTESGYFDIMQERQRLKHQFVSASILNKIIFGLTLMGRSLRSDCVRRVLWREVRKDNKVWSLFQQSLPQFKNLPSMTSKP
jgi:glycosyltransferase involved in cell wall biosynthesis